MGHILLLFTFVHFFPLQVGLFVPHDGQYSAFLSKDKDILHVHLRAQR